MWVIFFKDVKNILNNFAVTEMHIKMYLKANELLNPVFVCVDVILHRILSLVTEKHAN